ncbi:hypothetical protein HAPS_0638 [Glaesserella parasuis SH0165]|uniref:Uncharacterized protein n=1 Tax=Glaesserella parasuis serovar 5 (strain SH0165) TaxID=557723 RepID=B8F4N8_GLAP5|nr:hypothetical protein HAPS_0638 [Glaesserella parasuis SH0165]
MQSTLPTDWNLLFGDEYKLSTYILAQLKGISVCGIDTTPNQKRALRPFLRLFE